MRNYDFILNSILLLLWSCRQSPPEHYKKSTSYTYVLQVDETSPMGGVEKRWQVRRSFYSLAKKPVGPQPDGYLEVYANFHAPNEVRPRTQFEPIPQDTLRIALTRAQMHTIYHLTRRVFALPRVPKVVAKNAIPPPPASHDLDSYVVVGFQPEEFHGPRLECAGYQEGNDAAYMLQYELMLLEKHQLDRQKQKGNKD